MRLYTPLADAAAGMQSSTGNGKVRASRHGRASSADACEPEVNTDAERRLLGLSTILLTDGEQSKNHGTRAE
jgi:hypothetical protein